jgi:transposase-like protein
MVRSGRDGSKWAPPHCPNPKCCFHSPLESGWTFKRAGFYTRQAHPRRIQRFTCCHCRRHFSTQTFSTTYWQKRPDLDRRIVLKTVGGMANRQIARDLGVAPKTIDERLARLGRHCMLFHQRMMATARPPGEIAVDGFESFELSQYYPFHHHVAVEKQTDFFVYFTDSELRRKGRMRPAQKRRRQKLEAVHGRPDPQAVRKDMTELLDVSLSGLDRATVYSDDHRSYPPALRCVRARITHHVTSSRDYRDRHNPLWEVNLLDLLIRHCGANHKRETIAWSKRRQASAERLAIFLVWRNYMKGRREKERGSPTPAMARGMTDRRLTVDEVLERRIFRDHVVLPPRWTSYYARTVRTRALGPHREHRLSYAF